MLCHDTVFRLLNLCAPVTSDETLRFAANASLRKTALTTGAPPDPSSVSGGILLQIQLSTRRS